MNSFASRFARFWIYLLIILLPGCNLPSTQLLTPTPFFPTMMPLASPVPTVYAPPTTSPPVVQLSPTLAPIVMPSGTTAPLPCNRAEFVGDVSIPDGTQISAGGSYTKTWRIRNAGSCTWNASYVLFFDHGEPMQAAPVQALTSGNVLPGSVVDVSVSLRAPSTPGMHQSYFRLRSSDNIVFGIGHSGQDAFWVRIIVVQPTITPTNTPIPVDFAQVVDYVAGGGGAGCGVVYPGNQPAFQTAQHGNSLQICIWGAQFGQPFNLMFTSPNHASIQPIQLQVDPNTLDVRWEGYGKFSSSAISGAEAPLLTIDTWIPINFPAGQWKVQASGSFQAEGDFTIEKSNQPPYIAAINSNRGSEFMPMNNVASSEHFLKIKDNGRINIIGTDYPANTSVYIALYHRLGDFQYSLVHTQMVSTDFLGSFMSELSQEVEVGQSYLIAGVMDPHTDMTEGDKGKFDKDLPHDLFTVVAP